jgi:hypothetical protein
MILGARGVTGELVTDWWYQEICLFMLLSSLDRDLL